MEEKIIEKLIEKKSQENNTICLTAYGQGVKDTLDHLKEDTDTYPAPRVEKMQYVVKILSKIMNSCGWVWETPNERVMQMLMEELGLYPFDDEDEMIKNTKVPEELYTLAIKKVPTQVSNKQGPSETCCESVNPNIKQV